MLQSSICKDDVARAARQELIIRGRLHREAVSEVLRTARQPLTAELREEIAAALAKATDVNADALARVARESLPPNVVGLGIGDLASAVSQNGEEDKYLLDLLQMELRGTSSSLDQLLGPYPGALAHWQKATEFLDAKEPDYENALKEAIAATEAVVKLLANDGKATLGGAVKSLKSGLHPGLVKTLDGLWAYSSDVPGARHGSTAPSAVRESDARFVYAVCGAIIRLLLEKP